MCGGAGAEGKHSIGRRRHFSHTNGVSFRA